MNKTSFNIIGIGEILWDIYEDGKYLGGAPANFAIHCQQLGDRGIIVSRIGNDESGKAMKNLLRARNLTTEFIQQDTEKPTGTVKVFLDEKGKPRFGCSVDVAFDYLQMDNNLQQLSSEADAILFGTLAQRNPVLRMTIHKFLSLSDNAFKIYDINLRGWNNNTEKIVHQSLNVCNAIKLNDHELEILKNAWQPGIDDISFLKFLIKRYNLKLAALTLGENGCILLNAEEIIQLKGIKIEPKDTTGCGDAFAAGLIYLHLRNKSLKEIALFSNLIGAFTALFAGATPAYSQSDLDQFRQSINND